MNDLHPGDEVLESVLRRSQSFYGPVKTAAREILAAFLKPKLKALEPRKKEAPAAYKLRVLGAFSGSQWLHARQTIARRFTEARGKALDEVNLSMAKAFAAGFNESAYVMALSGVEMWPMTEKVVDKLGISPPERTLKRRKDITYNASRLQTTVHSAILQGKLPKELPEYVANAMTRSLMSEMTMTARAGIFGASDSGAYHAGLEAAKAGIDVEKTWLAIMDMNVRTSHKRLHGETIPLLEKFRGDYGDLRFPHDPTAHPAEIMRCRCRMAVHVAGKSPGEYSRKILPTQTAEYKKWRDEQIRKAGSELLKLHKGG